MPTVLCKEYTGIMQAVWLLCVCLILMDITMEATVGIIRESIENLPIGGYYFNLVFQGSVYPEIVYSEWQPVHGKQYRYEEIPQYWSAEELVRSTFWHDDWSCIAEHYQVFR